MVMLAWLRRNPIVVALPLIAATGWLDYVTGPRIGLSLLYLIPVVAVAWLSGTVAAVCCGTFAAMSWLAADWLWQPPELRPISIWNGFTRLVIYVGAAYLVHRVRLDRAQMRTLNGELQDAVSRESLLARTDPLTGLPNSRSFLEQLGRELARARREKQAVCVLFLDLDDFKSINDHYGHAAGNNVLTAIGRLIVESVRAGDIVARMGGDEFVVLLWHTPREEAAHVVERITSRVASFAADYPKTRLGVSIGTAWFAEPPADPEDVLRIADREMYEEKTARKTVE